MAVVEWDDNKFRRACVEGTKKELQAYLDGGHVQVNGFPLTADHFILKQPKREKQALLPPPPIAKEQRIEDYLDPATLGYNKMAELAEAIIQKHYLTMESFLGSGRSRDIVVARREFCYVCYFKLAKTCKQIGNFMKKDHSTVVHHLQVATGKRNVNYHRAWLHGADVCTVTP